MFSQLNGNGQMYVSFCLSKGHAMMLVKVQWAYHSLRFPKLKWMDTDLIIFNMSFLLN